MQKEEPNKKPWYRRGWGLVVAILFWPYFLIWYAWAKSKWSKKVKIGVTAVVAVIMLPFMVATTTTKPTETPVQSNVVNQQQVDAEKQRALESQKAAEELARKEVEEKAAAEAAQKKAEEEAAAAKNAESAANSAASSQSTAPAAEPSANLPLKAICKDGSVSYQDTPSNPNYKGMCSDHGGIQTKLGRVL